ncbi:MAG: hypothetical protein GX234_10390 [Clostridiales bacterium]|nr:hypothetical protein [Clostridiales bacterium]
MENLNQNYRCSNCGGELGWDAAAGKWKCRFCDAEFDLADMQESGKTEYHEDNYEKGRNAAELGYKKSTDDTMVDPADLKVYKCRYCGAEIITDKNTAATFCVYCNNPIVVEEQLVEGFRPKYVIPFAQTKKEVKTKYLEFIKKPFTPDSFMTEEHIEKIKGVYIPFWLYNAEATGHMELECEKIQTRRSGNTEITDHDVYQVVRGGKIAFDHIPVDASSKTDNALMDSIEPFDLTKLVKFEMPYLAGFLAERYDEDDRTCYGRAKTRITNTLENKLNSLVTGYQSRTVRQKNIQVDRCDAEYALLPVWLLYTKYEGKDYTFAMNGESGVMCGDIPVDKGKMRKCFFKYSIITTAISFLVSLVIAFVSLI